MREWNPLWHDVIASGNQQYLATIRHMVMASVNWLEQWPHAFPEWQERTLPIMASHVWDAVYQPTNDAATHWFDTIVKAAPAAPSSLMMRQAIICGIILRRDGWERFDRFMLEH